MSRGVLCQFFIITVLLKLAYQKVLYPQVIYYRCGYKNIQYYLMVNSFTHARLCFQPGIFAFNLKKSRKFFCKFCIFNILTVIVAKGEQRSHRPKGGENVKPNNHEQSKQHAFDSFCKKILKHEARDFYDELKRQRSREVSFSDLSAKQLEQFYTEDQYFATEQIFNALGLDVAVMDDVIAKALERLPERRRDVILLSYFLELSDREIGDKLNMLRATVQYQRTRTLQQLKKFMEGDTNE
jgi:RNA polymerase sigma factor (sigma-70 family)